MITNGPNNAIAGNLVAAALGCVPAEVRRFRSGSHHYVFEATFRDREPAVVRIAAEYSRQAMAGAYELSQLLRPKGVPLPKIIVEQLNHQFPHLILERLPGTDLGGLIRGLSDSSLEAIAAQAGRKSTEDYGENGDGQALRVRCQANRCASREVVAGSAR
jgi:aminoglycoside phosphotransferase